jgi:signal transduction histidine kinase
LTSRILRSLAVAAQQCSGVGAVSIWRVDRTRHSYHRLAISQVSLADPVCAPSARFWDHLPTDEQTFSVALSRLSESHRTGFVWGLPIASDPPFVYLFLGYQATRPLESWRVRRLRPFADVAKTVIQSQPRWSRQAVKARHFGSAGRWQAEEDVRQQIASVLHGPIQTKLLLLAKQVHDIREHCRGDGEQAARGLTQVEEALERLREEDIRRLSHRLYPDLIHVSLGAGLRALKQDIGHLAEVDLVMSPAFVTTDSLIDNQIPPLTRLGVYRIVEEAANNAVRHGQAAHVRIGLDALADSTLQIDIIDDGSGFNDPLVRGFGIRMMERWAQRLGGTMTFLPHVGTHLQLQVPLPSFVAQSVSR